MAYLPIGLYRLVNKRKILTETAPVQDAEFPTLVSPYRDKDGDRVDVEMYPAIFGSAIHVYGYHMH